MNILQQAEYGVLHAYLENKFKHKLGAPLMASTLVQDLITLITSVITTGSGTITTPSVTETIDGYEVSEVATVTIKKP